MRIAYLNSEYPSLSHTFIEREIRQLREAGWEIQTFSVHKAKGSATLGSAHHQAARQTQNILESRSALMGATLRALFTHPIRFAQTHIAAQKLSPPGLKSHIWHAAYTIEAVRLAQMLEREQIDHVHVHMANNGASIAMLATRFDPKLAYSLSIHGSAEFFHIDDWRLAPKAENALFVRCISEFCRAQVMLCTNPDRWEDFHVVRCGVDTSQFAPRERRDQRSEDSMFRLISVGRMHSIKGYDVLLRALAAVDQVHLTMVGDGSMLPRLQALAKDLAIEDRVQFAGPVAPEHLRGYLDQADAMVMSSFMEGVPVVLMEAMACGLPVIATRVGGIPELVEDGVSGLLADAGSPESLAHAIQSLASDPSRHRSMGQAGRRAVIGRYSIEQSGEGMGRLLARYVRPDASYKGVSSEAADEAATHAEVPTS